jgi:hypothetical protein
MYYLCVGGIGVDFDGVGVGVGIGAVGIVVGGRDIVGFGVGAGGDFGVGGIDDELLLG